MKHPTLFAAGRNIRREYTIIVPALDKTGPVNLAFDLGREASKSGWPVRVLHLNAGGEKRSDTGFAQEVRQFRASDIFSLRGVVHTHCLRPDLLGWFISWNRKCLLVTTLHNFLKLDIGFDYRPHQVWLAWHLWRRAISRYDHVVCISNAMKRYYHRQLPRLSLDLARNFRDVARGDVPSQVTAWIDEQQARSRKIIAYAGSLSPRKNVRALMEAMLGVPYVALLVCGTGPDAAFLSQRAAHPSFEGRIFLAGQLSSPAGALAMVDALVLPSFAEGFPLVVLEAASTGRPSLMSNIAVHRELATLGFGRTFDHHTFSDFPRQLEALFSSRPAPDSDLQDLWAREYSARPGFSRYEAIFEASTAPLHVSNHR